MSRRVLAIVGALLVVGGFLAMSSLFIVTQNEQALVLQFGQPRRYINQPGPNNHPGLYLKWPLVENVIYYDKRLLDFEPPPEEVIASDQKRLVVDTYARYRITDPLKFYQTVNSEDAVRARLSNLVNSSLRDVVGNITLSDILSEKRAAIMHQIRDKVRTDAKPFGIEVIDVRIRRADLPAENSQAIFARMQSERQQQAAQYRGEGAQAAQTVRATADRERTVILAEAQRKAQEIRGDGDAQAIKIYAKAFGQDEQFFAFYRSLQAYRDALSGKDTSFVLSPESKFFRFFQGWAGATAPAGSPAQSSSTPAPAVGGAPAR